MRQRFLADNCKVGQLANRGEGHPFKSQWFHGYEFSAIALLGGVQSVGETQRCGEIFSGRKVYADHQSTNIEV